MGKEREVRGRERERENVRRYKILFGKGSVAFGVEILISTHFLVINLGNLTILLNQNRVKSRNR
jgi:hypothetical protein